MSTVFSALDTTRSGLGVYRTWLNAVSDNIANMDTARRTSDAAFQARYIVAKADDGGGVHVDSIAFGSADGRVVNEPGNPLADSAGNVRYPDIDLSEQMVDLMVAQRGYQANLSVVDRVRDSYQQALQIGK